MSNDASEDLGITDFDVASELTTPKEAQEFLQACMDEAPEDGAFIAHAFGVVARAQSRMAAIAGESGLSRESLYKALSGRRDPAFSTILKVAAGLGLRLQFVAAEEARHARGAPSVDCVPLQTVNSASRSIEFADWAEQRLSIDVSSVASGPVQCLIVDRSANTFHLGGTGVPVPPFRQGLDDDVEPVRILRSLTSAGIEFIPTGRVFGDCARLLN